MLNIQKKAFKKELTELLRKYNVSISTGGYGDYFEVKEIGTNQDILIINEIEITSSQLDNNCEVVIKEV